MADATGVPQSTLSEIERQESKNPSGPVLVKLAAFYEVEPHWIITGHGPRNTVGTKGDSETELLLYYRALSPEGQQYLLSRARVMHSEEHKGETPTGKRPKLPDDPGGSRYQ